MWFTFRKISADSRMRASLSSTPHATATSKVESRAWAPCQRHARDTILPNLSMLSITCTYVASFTSSHVSRLTYLRFADPVASDHKPETLLLDDDSRIKIMDFGTGELIDVPRSFSSSFAR
ncbi:hypothetical protein EI94DRAFT_392150 [Lactarius quietus]|nr:hypothetical protein EI94DRAFT_392150 [Lactarius quietus]